MHQPELKAADLAFHCQEIGRIRDAHILFLPGGGIDLLTHRLVDFRRKAILQNRFTKDGRHPAIILIKPRQCIHLPAAQRIHSQSIKLPAKIFCSPFFFEPQQIPFHGLPKSPML